jgi:uncharacterized protein (TIGR02246 family)
MKSTLKLLAPLVALGFTLAATAGDKDVSAKDRASITELIRNHDAALAAADVQRYFTLMTDDYLEMPGGAPPLQGRDAARKPLDEFLAKNQFAIKSAIQDIKVSGDWAYVRNDNEQRVTPRNGESPLEIHGKQVLLLHREKDGGWKIQTNMWNSNGPPQPLK